MSHQFFQRRIGRGHAQHIHLTAHAMDINIRQHGGGIGNARNPGGNSKAHGGVSLRLGAVNGFRHNAVAFKLGAQAHA